MIYSIPIIPLDFFVQLWGINLIIGLSGYAFKIIALVKDYKEKLRNNINRDNETKIPFIDIKIEKLLKFKDKKYLIILTIVLLISFILGLIYIGSLSITQISYFGLIEITISLCGWIALIAVIIAYIIDFRFFIYFIQLVIKTSE